MRSAAPPGCRAGNRGTPRPAGTRRAWALSQEGTAPAGGGASRQSPNTLLFATLLFKSTVSQETHKIATDVLNVSETKNRIKCNKDSRRHLCQVGWVMPGKKHAPSPPQTFMSCLCCMSSTDQQGSLRSLPSFGFQQPRQAASGQWLCSRKNRTCGVPAGTRVITKEHFGTPLPAQIEEEGPRA